MHINDEFNSKTPDACKDFCINMQKSSGYVPAKGACGDDSVDTKRIYLESLDLSTLRDMCYSPKTVKNLVIRR